MNEVLNNKGQHKTGNSIHLQGRENLRMQRNSIGMVRKSPAARED
jgi:hypothetical protein